MDLSILWILRIQLLVFAASLYINAVSADGELLVLLESYSNPEGRLQSGRCCDNVICALDRGCDYSFAICLDGVNSTTYGDRVRTAACTYGKYYTDVVQENQNDLVFGSQMNTVPNPVSFIIPGAINKLVTLKVSVQDEDGFSRRDAVDFLRADVYLYKGIFTELLMPLDMVARTSLHTILTIKCAENWYGEDCTAFCAPPPLGHYYSCSAVDGHKICDRGWSGENCSVSN